ncbi:hypothetical protein Tco_0191812, partial [Tanacetum coccineum]
DLMGLNPRRDSPYVMGFPIGSTIWALEARIDVAMAHSSWAWFQVNTKFLNTLPDEWSKFVTDVKLVKDLHTTNVDQLHAYLQQHERHANEVRLMHERNSDPLALVASHQLTQPAYQSHLHTHPKSLSQLNVTPYQTQQFTTNQSTPFSITYPSNEYQSTVHHNVYSPQLSIP